MPKIVLIVEDEQGERREQVFLLSGDLDTLDGIDEAVEHFKNAALPQVEQELLTRALERAAAQEKKRVPVR